MKNPILKLLILAMTILLPQLTPAKVKDTEYMPQYQVMGAGRHGSEPKLNISILSKKKDVSDADLAKAAVHAILFRDFTNSNNGSISNEKCLMGSPTAEQEHIDFFEPFFTNGDALRYVQIVGNTRRVVKVNKQYKISADVVVNKSQLRKDLKKQNLLKDASKGW